MLFDQMILPEESKMLPLVILGILKDKDELVLPMLKFVCEALVSFNSFSIVNNVFMISWRKPMDVLPVNHASLLVSIKESATAVNIKKMLVAIRISRRVKPFILFILSIRYLSYQLYG